MSEETAEALARRNAELSARVTELTRALAQAEVVSQLSLGVVHDLRNAFHVIVVAGETLAASLRDPSEAELAEAVLDAANHANALAGDLLTLARREAPRTMRIDGGALNSVERLVRRIGKQLDLAFDVARDVWQVEVEPQQLQAALINLCVNARDAMPHGGELRVGARNLPRGSPALPAGLVPGEYVEYYVADTGMGMTAEVLARATEAFFTTKGHGGTGLGLAMASAFADRFGGALAIDSEVGRGTCVRIVLPRAAPLPAARAASSRDAQLRKLEGRVRSAGLRQILDAWHTACSDDELPRRLHVERALSEHIDSSLVLSVERAAEPPRLRLVRMGDALLRALGGGELGEVPLEGSVVLGTLGAAYRRVLHSRFPSYEYARYAFGSGEPGEFERVILPAADDGRVVSHLIGVVQLSHALVGGGDHVET